MVATQIYLNTKNPQIKSTHEGLEKFGIFLFNPETPFFSLTCRAPSPLSFFSFSPPHTQSHTYSFCYQFKAQREVSEGACQSDKLSPKWWQIGRLSARLPIKSRPGFRARTVPVNGDQWHSGEARSPLAQPHTVSTLSLPYRLKSCLESNNWIYLGLSGEF